MLEGAAVIRRLAMRPPSSLPLSLLAALPLMATAAPDGSCPAPRSYCSAGPNSVHPTGSFLSHQGSSSVEANDLILVAVHLPLDQPGLFFCGPHRVQLPFGDGFRCVGAPAWRLDGVDTGAAGIVAYELDVAAARGSFGGFTPGSTWRFQLWYADPAGPGGSGFNLSDGLEVRFCP